MFTKNKVSQSMIDAVKNIINESGTPIKEPTSTGMRVYGRSYGNSAKAKQDQTKSDLDKIKGPKDKEMKEAAKPDFLDMDKDGNKKESMKKAIADKEKGVKEELKGNQDKIDANHNNKIDGQDFKILRAKKKVTEDMHFAKKLLEAQKMKQSPAKNQDVADKSYLKDKPGVKSDLKNLGRFLTGKKETNEELEIDNEINEVLSKDATAGDYIHDFIHSDNPKFAGKSKAERKKMALGAYYGKQNEGKRPETDDAPPFDEPYTKLPGNVKDKSGAVHTPMSRARDLARAAMKKVKTEMLGKTGTSGGKKW